MGISSSTTHTFQRPLHRPASAAICARRQSDTLAGIYILSHCCICSVYNSGPSTCAPKPNHKWIVPSGKLERCVCVRVSPRAFARVCGNILFVYKQCGSQTPNAARRRRRIVSSEKQARLILKTYWHTLLPHTVIEDSYAKCPVPVECCCHWINDVLCLSRFVASTSSTTPSSRSGSNVPVLCVRVYSHFIQAVNTAYTAPLDRANHSNFPHHLDAHTAACTERHMYDTNTRTTAAVSAAMVCAVAYTIDTALQ